MVLSAAPAMITPKSTGVRSRLDLLDICSSFSIIGIGRVENHTPTRPFVQKLGAFQSLNRGHPFSAMVKSPSAKRLVTDLKM